MLWDSSILSTMQPHGAKALPISKGDSFPMSFEQPQVALAINFLVMMLKRGEEPISHKMACNCRLSRDLLGSR